MRHSAVTIDSKYDRNVQSFLSYSYYSALVDENNEARFNRLLGYSDTDLKIMQRKEVFGYLIAIPETHPLYNSSLFYFCLYHLKKQTERFVMTSPITDALKLERWTIR